MPSSSAGPAPARLGRPVPEKLAGKGWYSRGPPDGPDYFTPASFRTVKSKFLTMLACTP